MKNPFWKKNNRLVKCTFSRIVLFSLQFPINLVYTKMFRAKEEYETLSSIKEAIQLGI